MTSYLKNMIYQQGTSFYMKKIYWCLKQEYDVFLRAEELLHVRLLSISMSVLSL